MCILQTAFRILRGCHCLALLLGVGLLQAGPITYTFSGTGTGALGSTSFTSASFVVTLAGDTSDVGPVAGTGGLSGIAGLPANINIAGVGLLDFTGGAFILAEGGFDNVIFGVTDNLINISNPSLFGYDLASDFTTSGTNFSGALADFNNVGTGGGLLSFSSMSSVTFQSELGSSTPEPQSLFMLASAFVIAPFLRRMRPRSSDAVR
jgi:hypothetical protein